VKLGKTFRIVSPIAERSILTPEGTPGFTLMQAGAFEVAKIARVCLLPSTGIKQQGSLRFRTTLREDTLN
jgi:hypothetical protein